MHNLYVLPIMVFIAFSASAFEYTITGDFNSSECDGKKAYLMLYDNNMIIDSAIVNDGKLTMKSSSLKSGNARIDVGREYANLILSPGEIVVDFENHVPLFGDSLNMELRDYWIKTNNFIKIARDLSHWLQKRNMSTDSLAMLKKDIMRSVNKIFLEFNKSVLYDNLDNPLGEIAMRSFALEAAPNEWREIYGTLSPYLLSLNFTNEWNIKMKKAATTEKGAMFKDIEGRSVGGEISKLSDYLGKGKYVLVDFWASWCMPCRHEASTTLKPIYEKYGSDPRFEILGVATWDDPEHTIKMIQSEEYKWPQIIDAGMKPMEEYGFDRIPMIILFAPDGTIAARNIRGVEIWKTIESALQ